MQNMKMHKIPSVSKEICAAEQKIAYNYAFQWRESLGKIYYSGTAQVVKSDAYQDIIRCVINSIKLNGIDRRYNIDAIIHCFHI